MPNNHTSSGSLFVPFVCGKWSSMSFSARGPIVTWDWVERGVNWGPWTSVDDNRRRWVLMTPVGHFVPMIKDSMSIRISETKEQDKMPLDGSKSHLRFLTVISRCLYVTKNNGFLVYHVPCLQCSRITNLVSKVSSSPSTSVAPPISWPRSAMDNSHRSTVLSIVLCLRIDNNASRLRYRQPDEKF